jgi:hypothetical protein
VLTGKRQWFAIQQLLAYNGKQNTTVVAIRSWELRKNITKNQGPGVLLLVNDLKHDKLSLISPPFDPAGAKETFKSGMLYGIHLRECVIPIVIIDLS